MQNSENQDPTYRTLNIQLLAERMENLDERVSSDYLRIEAKIDQLAKDLKELWHDHKSEDKELHDSMRKEIGELKLEMAVMKTKMVVIGAIGSVACSAVVSIVMKFLGA